MLQFLCGLRLSPRKTQLEALSIKGNMMRNSGLFTTTAVAASFALLMTACGGGGSSSSRSVDTSEIGVFTDGPVSGVAYKTETRSGVTNASGEFRFFPGETVTFTIGDVDLPSVAATGRITPLDMGTVTNGELSNEVINILRLLQTLDEDGDPDNGIQIPKGSLIGVAPDFSADPAQFEMQVGLPLISEAEAKEHFFDSEKASLRKSWVYEETDGSINVLTFISDNEYIIAHSNADNVSQIAASAEYGTYTLDPLTGEFEVAVMEESDCSGGFDESSWTLRFQGADLVLTPQGSDDEAAIRFLPVESATNPLIGAWLVTEAPGRFNVLTFLDENRYVVAHNSNEEAYQDSAELRCADDVIYEAGQAFKVSSEWGEYQFSQGRFRVTGNHAETDGPGGLYDKTGNMGLVADVEVSPYGDLHFLPETEDSFSAMRIGRFEVALQDLAAKKSTITIERVATNAFTEGQARAFEFTLAGEEGSPQVWLHSNGAGQIAFAPDEHSTIESWRVVPGVGTLVFEERMEGESSSSTWAFAPIRTRGAQEKALVDFGSQFFFISELQQIAD